MSGQPSRDEHPLSDPQDPSDQQVSPAGVKRKRSTEGTNSDVANSASSSSDSPRSDRDTVTPSVQDGTAATSVNNLPDTDIGDEQVQTPTTTSTSAPTPTHAVVAPSSPITTNINLSRLRYKPPQESRMPDKHWRLYVIKDGTELDVLHTHRQPSFLLGRDRSLADIFTDHPSCSKQHAVLQFREITRGENQVILPFLVDLDSTNGTFVNGQRIPAHMFYELRASDVIKFAQSTREYVLMDPDQI